MKILLVPYLYLPNIGGTQITVSNLASEFKRKGHYVEIIAHKSPKELPKFEVINGIRVNRVFFTFPNKKIKYFIGFILRFPRTLISMISIIQRIKPDVINMHLLDTNSFYVLLMKLIFRIPVVAFIRGGDIPNLHRQSYFVRFVIKKLLEKSDYVLSNSKYMFNESIKVFPFISAKGSVVNNGINLSNSISREIKNIKKYSDPFIFSAGRLIYQKGFDILIRAFKIIHDESPNNISLKIAGNGPDKESLFELTKKLGLNDKVEFLGELNRNEITYYYNECEFFVLTSRCAEAFGNVCLEAIAAGKPVIASDVGGVGEIIQNEINGFLIKPIRIIQRNAKMEQLYEIDERSLASMIKRLIDNPTERRLMGEKGREIAVNNFSWDKIEERYEKVFKMLLSQNISSTS